MRSHPTKSGLILLYVAFNLGLATRLLTSVFRNLPAEVIAAPLVDGACWRTVTTRVTLPTSTSRTATVAIFTGLVSWNELLPQFFTSRKPRPSRWC